MGKLQVVLRFFSLVLIPLLLLGPPLAAQNSIGDIRPRPLGQAMDAVRAGNWQNAAQLAARDGIVAVDVVRWQRLLVGLGTYAEFIEFIERRPDWPSMSRLRRANEIKLTIRRDAEILAHFDKWPPQTATGALTYIAALKRADRTNEATALAQKVWTQWRLGQREEAAMLKHHGEVLKASHEERLRNLLWRGRLAEAERMLPRVSDAQRKLARARIALQKQASGVDAAIEAVPKALQTSPGLIHDRMQWRLRKGRWEGAREILLDQARSGGDLGNPQSWARSRATIARDTLRDGLAQEAYDISAAHGLTSGAAYADLEWLSGFIALRHLNKPEQAEKHFRAHDAAVRSPISKGRAGYWIGRALAAQGKTDAAQQAFAEGAKHQTSFYGLLAAEAAGLPFDVGLSETPSEDWRTSELLQNSLFQAGLLLAASDERTLAERFWAELARQLPTEMAALLGQAAIDAGEPHLAVMIGKTVARRGEVIAEPYYPLHPLAGSDLPVQPELALAIARRESEFDPVVISGAGARGLMQLMPRTAKEVARRLEMSEGHDTARLTSDPVYNATLGSAYLADLIDTFDGNIVMVSAAYNAGPSRPLNWMKRFGNPLGSDIETMVDWIEGIPFDETRNYVMRVSESLPIYRARLGRDPLPMPFSQELLGGSLTRIALRDTLAPEGE